MTQYCFLITVVSPCLYYLISVQFLIQQIQFFQTVVGIQEMAFPISSVDLSVLFCFLWRFLYAYKGFRQYADNTQLYISAKPDARHQLNKVEGCVKDVKHWMLSNFLLLYSDRTEVLLPRPQAARGKLSDYVCDIIVTVTVT